MNIVKSDNIPEPRNISNKQPKAHQLLLKIAVETLTAKQKAIWFRWNNERLTQDEISALFKISRSTVRTYITRIESKLTKYIKKNLGAYLLLKIEHKIMNEEIE